MHEVICQKKDHEILFITRINYLVQRSFMRCDRYVQRLFATIYELSIFSAIFSIYLFSVQLGWMPSFGRGENLVEIFPGWKTGFLSRDGLMHLVLPSFSLSSIMLPLFIRLIRSEMREVLESEYVRFAWAKGLAPRRVWFLHALKNTMLPVVTVGGVQIGTMLAYTILTETVFQWPGMGFLFLEAVNRVDTPLIIAYIIVVGLIFVITNTVVDLIYTWVNPTVKIADKNR